MGGGGVIALDFRCGAVLSQAREIQALQATAAKKRELSNKTLRRLNTDANVFNCNICHLSQRPNRET